MNHKGAWLKLFYYLLFLSFITCLFMSVEAGMAEESGVIQAQEVPTNGDNVSTEEENQPTAPQNETGAPEKGITHTQEVPFSKETIEEIKTRESLQPEIVPEPWVAPFHEEPPPKELIEPSPGSQSKILYEYSQTPVSDGNVSTGPNTY